MAAEYSTSPGGERFPLPNDEDKRIEFERLRDLVARQREKGREIVVVMGLGFVGAVMAAIVADTQDINGEPNKFVIGMQRPSPRSFWKIPLINKGISPVKAEDPEVAPMIHRCVKEKETFVATYIYEALKLADVIIVDIQCDFKKESLGDVSTGSADTIALGSSSYWYALAIASFDA